jgi:hypothetical protein
MTGQEKARGGGPRYPIGGRAMPSAPPGTAEDPFRAVLAAMQSAGLIPGRPAQPDRGTRGGS